MKSTCNNYPKVLLALIGPTASGKSPLGVLLAQKFDGEIISADSRQVYRGLNLGSGKITKKEMQGIPHHLLDVASPKRRYSAARFREEAGRALTGIARRGKMPIVVGGTGFYLAALVGDTILSDVPPDQKLRKELSKSTTEKLFQKLIKLDPSRAAKIDRNNPARLVRAIEVAQFQKTQGANFASQNSLPVFPFQVVKIGIDLPDEALKKRIENRLDLRLKKGMLAEAERLHADGLSFRRMEELGLEYGAMAKQLQGKTSLEAMKQEILSQSWRYAKRQRTWWKHDQNITWFAPGKEKEIVAFAEKQIKLWQKEQSQKALARK